MSNSENKEDVTSEVQEVTQTVEEKPKRTKKAATSKKTNTKKEDTNKIKEQVMIEEEKPKTTKKSTTKKSEEKPKTTKKSTVKKTELNVKEEIKSETTEKKTRTTKIKEKIVIEYMQNTYNKDDIIEKVKQKWEEQGNNIKNIKSIELYIQPDNKKVYYVINEVDNKNGENFVEL